MICFSITNKNLKSNSNGIKSVTQKKNLKIAILVAGFPPTSVGGTENATYQIARYLANLDHEVHVITWVKLENNINNKFFIHSVNLSNIKFLNIIFLWEQILIIIKKINPDIIHIQGLPVGIGGILAKFFLKKPYVIYGRGSDVYNSSFLKRIFLKFFLKNANLIIALTLDMKKEIKKICEKDIITIPNGIDYERFQNISREKIRKEFKIPKDEKIILFVGRLHSIKGINYLISSMQHINRKVKKVRLVIVGAGEEMKRLKDLADRLHLSELIFFMGEISNDSIPKFMCMSDVFVLPSLREGFPNTLLEAMASGLPIIASDVSGIPEIIKNGENGFIVNSKNPLDIANRAVLLLQNDELRGKIRVKNKEEVKKYDWKNITQILECNYRRIIKNNSDEE